eukprot:2611545-Prorocentrum_lima.AAC.1
MSHDVQHLDSLSGVTHKNSINEGPQERAKPGRVGELDGLDLAEELARGALVEGQEASHQDVEDHATAPDVRHVAVVSLISQHLRSDVVRRAARGVEQLGVRLRSAALPVQRAQAEVADLQVVVRVQKQVLRLQVSVADPTRVAIVHPFGQLPK